MNGFIRQGFSKVRTMLGVTSVQTAADDDLIVTVADMKNGAYTIAAQPTSPCKIGIKNVKVGNVDTLGVITLVGTDIMNQTITEVITVLTAATVWSTKIFKTITSATGSGWVVSADTSKDTIIIGIPATGLIEVKGQSIRIKCVSGKVYINDKATATADSASYLMSEGEILELVVSDNLSFISDGNAATFEFIIWEA